VSDYFAVEQLNALHHVVDSDDAAARLAFESGVDIELPDPKMFPKLLAQVKSKAIPMALVDKSVARVLRAKFELGLFEQPYVDVEQADKIAGNAEYAALARKAADRSIVLLKNQGGLLPLDKAKVKTIAVVGPNAEPCRLGGYSGVPKRCVGVLRGIKEAVGNGVKVMWAPGCGITKGSDWWADAVEQSPIEDDRKMINDAVAVARKADVVVLALGDSEQSSREAWAPNHLGDRPSLDLPGRQDDLARAVLAIGKPTVAVLLNGRPPSINVLAQQAGAISRASTWARRAAPPSPRRCSATSTPAASCRSASRAPPDTCPSTTTTSRARGAGTCSTTSRRCTRSVTAFRTRRSATRT
jgi:beta-glucosidase